MGGISRRSIALTVLVVACFLVAPPVVTSWSLQKHRREWLRDESQFVRPVIEAVYAHQENHGAWPPSLAVLPEQFRGKAESRGWVYLRLDPSRGGGAALELTGLMETRLRYDFPGTALGNDAEGWSAFSEDWPIPFPGEPKVRRR